MSDKRMDMGWKYYNHAAVPTCAPHEEPNMLPIHDKSIWKIDGKTPLFARWTTDFDCGYETNWWYVIKDGPFDIEEVSAKERKSVRQALKKSVVKLIDPIQYKEALYECYYQAFIKYEGAGKAVTSEAFFHSLNGVSKSLDCWASFDLETDKLIGYMTVCVLDICVEILTAKFHPDFFKRQASDAMYFTLLDYYLNGQNKKYVSSGERSISHKTNTQEYKIRRFGYRKAYCKLNLAYRPHVKFVINMLYPFRRVLKKMDKISIIHKVNSILLMEEIIRSKA